MNIFLFHRDLRIIDNLALNQLLTKSKNVFLFFIFTRKQTSRKLNPYFSKRSFNFLLQSLKQLHQKAHINFFEANTEKEVFQEILKTKKIKFIYTNKDFTPFAKNRDLDLYYFCKENNIEYKSSFNDYLLFKPFEITSNNKNYFKVFTSFYKKALENIYKIKKPTNKIEINPLKYQNKFSIRLPKCDLKLFVPIKRENIFQNISLQQNYEYSRNILSLENGTSQVSAALKFGVISIREAFWFACKQFEDFNHLFIRQLIWREFFYHHYVCSSLSKDLVFGENIRPEFNSFPWIKNENNLNFIKWKNAKTKVEIIDASMNQLNQTGFMHNRARMIVASYLTKDLNIHWQIGEKYFATKLVDYDPIVNNYSWQWVAGSGLDYQNYYRVFAPEKQVEKFDPQKEYIKKHLPKNHLKEEDDLKKTRDLYRKRLKKWQTLK